MQNDVRAALQYVPLFRGKLFVVMIETAKLPESAVAECLLDLAALEDVGVKLVLGVLGGDVKDFYDWSLECEIKVARCRHEIGSEALTREAREILQRGQVPVFDASHLSSLDPMIVQLVMDLHATKLITIHEHGLLSNREPVHALSVQEAMQLIDEVPPADAISLRAAVSACEAGVPRVHVLNGNRQGVLVDELFSNEGVGTMIHADSYRSIRELHSEDIPELLSMIGRSVRRSFLVPRNYEEIEARIQDYWVMVIDDNVVGCVALHEYPEDQCAELACLYVKHAHEGRGYGADLVEHAEKMAREKGIPRVIALTTRAIDFFGERMGYALVGTEALPEKRRHMLLASGRGSAVFEKVFQ